MRIRLGVFVGCMLFLADGSRAEDAKSNRNVVESATPVSNASDTHRMDHAAMLPADSEVCGYRSPDEWRAAFQAAVEHREIPDPSLTSPPAVAPRAIRAGGGACAPPPHRTDIFTFEDSAGLLLTNFSSGQLFSLMTSAANALLVAEGDNFDIVGYWVNFVPHHQIGSAFWLGLENDVTGIGQSIFNNRPFFGQAGDNVEGYIMMWNINDGIWAPGTAGNSASFTRLVFAQEIEHRWGVFIPDLLDGRRMQGGGGCGRGAHWNFQIDGQGSGMEMREWIGSSPAVLGGNCVNFAPNECFNTDTGGVFSYTDLYLMGFVSPAEMDAGNSELRFMNGGCNSPYNGPISNFSSADIVASAGTRNPSSAASQHNFHIGWIMFHQPGDPPSHTELDKAVGILAQQTIDWEFSTLGVGTLNTTLQSDCAFTVKFSQRARPGGENIASNIDWTDDDPNVVVADDFVSDGRPINTVRWWGSELTTAPQPDGWFISFHEPLVEGLPPQSPLGLYFCDEADIQVDTSSVPPCDGQIVLAYEVDLASCCLVHAHVDSRTGLIPAQIDGFFEELCLGYAIDIQAVVGHKFVDDGSGTCLEEATGKSWDSDVWGWYSTSTELGTGFGLGPALQTVVSMIGSDWLYGPWGPVNLTCGQRNMAFELITATEIAENPDVDGDGVPNVCDPCPDSNPDDSDDDGVCDSEDICIGGDDALDDDGDTVPDFCDVCPGGDDTVDSDGDGMPDECDIDTPRSEDSLSTICVNTDQCAGTSFCLGGRCYVHKNRYISIHPDNLGKAVKLEVTLSTSLPHPGLVGTSWWVLPPAGVVPGSRPKPLLGPSECVAVLGPEAAAAEIDWIAAGCLTLHITGCPIEPTSEYEVRAVGTLSASPAVMVPTAPLPLNGRFWGDVAGDNPGGTGWQPPQGTTNINDVFAILETFKGGQVVAPTALMLHLTWSDLQLGDINTVVNIADVQACILAFNQSVAAGAYPYGPADADGCCDPGCHD